MDRDEILYVGSFVFPEGSASAARVLGIGKGLRDAGYRVRFIGAQAEGREEDWRPGEGHFYQGFPYCSAGEVRSNRVSGIGRLTRYLRMGEGASRFLQSADVSRVLALTVYNPLTGWHIRLRRFCRARGIALVVDCTEWLDPTQYPGGRCGLHRCDVELTMRRLNACAGRVIAISSYLECFYRNRGASVVRIPPVVDLGEEKWRSRRLRGWGGPPLRLVYAGWPGRKDPLANVLAALCDVVGEGKDVVLELIGPTEPEVRCLLGAHEFLLKRLGQRIVFRGPFPQSAVPELLSQADVGVLLRPRKRYAEAGFPTKLVEYLSARLPVVTNATSDIAEYVRDGVEGFLVGDYSREAFAEGIRRAAGSRPEKLQEMSVAAYRRAEESFDYRRHVDSVKAFFGSLARGS